MTHKTLRHPGGGGAVVAHFFEDLLAKHNVTQSSSQSMAPRSKHSLRAQVERHTHGVKA